jgi:hypothetical protein
MSSPPQYISNDYFFAQIQAPSLKLWSEDILTIFTNLSMYATCVFFL